MLDSETKRRIDTARDILVGKVPDPKSQVEQITIALIYKFMDDMDAQAEELGGKRKFFIGEYASYGWAKLMAPSVSGEERIALYADGMVKMTQNPGVPKLFRDIFKNAFLPYRDAETLKLFLKTIDEFEYDHSERLGDAFEYLLSVLGSQGQAGQFRTPRHIIDFIVAIVDPKKNETVLDPACGTGGFLISAWKHILRANSTPGAIEKTSGNGEAALHTSRIPPAKGDLLTPDERKKLADNFRGYDISPDMVRLSLVNMYLHGFTDPHVFEYDTLTSQDRWNEMADVILANPPFMSPKGGIKPHNRFTVQSKRSEVLFVDYMAEHLTPGGRAGVIVPEGIIFQSQTAYKALRKMLVEQYLVAVVSLPQGVFNPYSGVKTSILFFDRPRAKQSDGILFVRVTDDGFDLGATRKRTGEGDFPKATRLIQAWQHAIDNGNRRPDIGEHAVASVVERETILASPDCGLSADRYRSHAKSAGISWVPLSEILDASDAGRVGENNELPVLSVTMKDGLVDQGDKFKKRIASADISDYKRVPRNDLVVGFPIDEGVLGIQSLYDCAAVSPAYNIWTVTKTDDVDLPFLEKVLRSDTARERYRLWMRGTAGRRRTLDKADFLRFEIPLPPLEVQKEIVAEIEGYQRVIDGARAVLDHYRPHIPIQPDWPMVELGEICDPEYGYTASAADMGDARFIRITDISDEGTLRASDAKYVTLNDEARQSLLSTGDLLVARTGGTFGKTMIFEEEYPAVFASFLIRLRFPADKVAPRYYWAFAQSDGYWSQANALVTGGGQPQFNGNAIKRVRIPLPPLPVQRTIVSEIEAERRLVEQNRELIARMETKIAATLARIWGEDVP